MTSSPKFMMNFWSMEQADPNLSAYGWTYMDRKIKFKRCDN